MPLNRKKIGNHDRNYKHKYNNNNPSTNYNINVAIKRNSTHKIISKHKTKHPAKFQINSRSINTMENTLRDIQQETSRNDAAFLAATLFSIPTSSPPRRKHYPNIYNPSIEATSPDRKPPELQTTPNHRQSTK